MKPCPTTAWLALAAVCLCGARAEETNAWPGPVSWSDGRTGAQSWTAAGPFLFDQPDPDGGRLSGLRPFYVRRADPSGQVSETTALYPIYTGRRYGDHFEWSIFKLINGYGRVDGARPTPSTEPATFDVWPFYFSKDTGDPTTSRRALMPVAGTVDQHFGYDRISWVLFPLYARTERKGSSTTYTPWPLMRVTQGAAQGFAIWPLFGHLESPGAYDRRYVLWPLFWANTVQAGPDAPAGTPPTRQVGALPFYASEKGPGFVNEAYLWPFFGYTDRTAPYRYSEVRYLWPFLVQGTGDDRLVNRWAPFYSHSVVKGVDKTWAPWPLVRLTNWTDGNVAQAKTQVFYFIYWRLEQRSTTNPAAAPAEKAYLWPILSTWDNGAGRRQVQVLSPFEGMFADNPRVRAAWSPLFALVRYEQTAPGESSTSVLWNAVTWRSSAVRRESEFHLGPILGVRTGPGGTRWSPFGLEIAPKGPKLAASPH